MASGTLEPQQIITETNKTRRILGQCTLIHKSGTTPFHDGQHHVQGRARLVVVSKMRRMMGVVEGPVIFIPPTLENTTVQFNFV